MADSSRVPVDPGEFDPYHKWLGIPISEQPPNHYRLLGIELFEDDLDVIEAAGNRQSAFLRQLALGPHMQASQRLLNEMAKAQVCLLRPDRKAAYDEQLQATLQPAVAPDRAAVAPSRGQRTPVEDTAESATSAAERRPSFPKQVANWRKQGQAFLSRVPRKYRYAAGAGLGVCVLLLMVVAMWPEPVDPHGPAKVKVLVDDAFSKNFADKLVVYAIDETPYAIGTLQSGIVLEPGEHTLEVKVGEKPPAAKTDDKTPSPKSPAQDAKTVFTRKFMVVATEPPTLQLSFVDGKIADTMLLALSDKTFELPDGSAGEALVLQGVERESFTQARVTGSGRYLISGSSDGFVRLWNLEAGKSIRRFRPGRVLYALAVAPDGFSILANGDGYELRHMNLGNGQVIRSLEGHTGYPVSVAFSPDGQSAVSAGGQGDGSIRLWDLETGNERWNFVRTGRSARDVAYSADGAWVFAVVDDNLVQISAESGVQDAMYDAGTPFVITPDGEGLIARGIGSNYQLWHAESALEVRDFKARSSGPIAISPNGRYVASVVADRKGPIIELWNAESGEEVTQLTGHTSDVYTIEFLNNGKFLATASRDGTCRVWRLPKLDDAATGDAIKTPQPAAPESGSRLRQFRFAQVEAAASRDGRVVGALYYGSAKVWESQTGRLILKTVNHSAEHMCLSQDGRYAVTSSSQLVHVWDIATGQELNRVAVPASAVRGLSLLPDNRAVLVSLRLDLAGPLTPMLIDLVSGAELGRFPESSQPAVVSGDGKFVAVIQDTVIDLYDIATGEWCRDSYAAFAYRRSQIQVSDPVVDEVAARQRVSRGGSFAHSAVNARSSHRARLQPFDAKATVGFRVVRTTGK